MFHNSFSILLLPYRIIMDKLQKKGSLLGIFHRGSSLARMNFVHVRVEALGFRDGNELTPAIQCSSVLAKFRVVIVRWFDVRILSRKASPKLALRSQVWVDVFERCQYRRAKLPGPFCRPTAIRIRIRQAVLTDRERNNEMF